MVHGSVFMTRVRVALILLLAGLAGIGRADHPPENAPEEEVPGEGIGR